VSTDHHAEVGEGEPPGEPSRNAARPEPRSPVDKIAHPSVHGLQYS
jgi:hypothetical protein